MERTKGALERRTHDFALWRAAEATLENGYTHFIVEETTAQTRKHIIGRDPDLPPYRGYNYRIIIRDSAYRSTIWLQPMVTVKARFLPEATVGAATIHDAQAVLTRFESAYPLAREPVNPPVFPNKRKRKVSARHLVDRHETVTVWHLYRGQGGGIHHICFSDNPV